MSIRPFKSMNKRFDLKLFRELFVTAFELLVSAASTAPRGSNGANLETGSRKRCILPGWGIFRIYKEK